MQRFIYWSEQDLAYLGWCDNCGICCHGDSIEEVHDLLDVIEEEIIEIEEFGLRGIAN